MKQTNRPLWKKLLLYVGVPYLVISLVVTVAGGIYGIKAKKAQIINEPQTIAETTEPGTAEATTELTTTTTTEATTTTTTRPTTTTTTQRAATTVQQTGYVLNTSTKKIHRPDCASVRDILPQNFATTNDFAGAITAGYVGCKKCYPHE